MVELFDWSDSLEQLLILSGIVLAVLPSLLEIGLACVAGGIGLMWSKGEIG
ncbi:hypothetical protein HYV43_03890 [Candidatus Micrarchaeota archaeon]|nr:hypothetical protein [Candidatus Micrarchaeota archaeon]